MNGHYGLDLIIIAFLGGVNKKLVWGNLGVNAKFISRTNILCFVLVIMVNKGCVFSPST